MFKIFSEPDYVTYLNGCSCDYITMLIFKDLITKYKNLESSEYFDFLWKPKRQNGLKYLAHKIEPTTQLNCFLEIFLLQVFSSEEKSVMIPLLRDNKKNYIGSLNNSHIYYTPVKDFTYDMLVTSFITDNFKGLDKKNDYFNDSIKTHLKAFLNYIKKVEDDYVNRYRAN